MPAAPALGRDADERGQDERTADHRQPQPEDERQEQREGAGPEDERPHARAGERADDARAVLDRRVAPVLGPCPDDALGPPPEEVLVTAEPAVPEVVVGARQETQCGDADEHHRSAVLVGGEPVRDGDHAEERADPDEEAGFGPHGAPSPPGPPGSPDPPDAPSARDAEASPAWTPEPFPPGGWPFPDGPSRPGVAVAYLAPWTPMDGEVGWL